MMWLVKRCVMWWKLRQLARSRARMMAHPVAQEMYNRSPAFRAILAMEGQAEAIIRKRYRL